MKFFFDVTLGQPDVMAKMQHMHVPRKLPVILSPEEVGRLIAAAPTLKHQAAMSVAYGAGLRVSEVVALKVSDIDGQRMTLRVEQGKGRKEDSPSLAHEGRCRTSLNPKKQPLVSALDGLCLAP